VHVGVALFASDWSSDVRDVARAAEASGFESFFVPEHTHIPVSRETPYPSGGELPPEYARTLDPFVALTAAASVTTTLRVGTGVCLVVERDPIHLAKQTATLDLLSGGRLLLGVGSGWNAEEMVDHGTDPAERWDVLRDRVLAVLELWHNDVAAYDGKHAHIPPSWQWPKPVQQPHPPVLVGGGSKRAMRHAVEYADGWMPMPERSRGSMADRMAALAALAAEAGRPVPSTTVYAARPDRDVLDHYAELGVERAVVMLPPRDDAVAAVEQLGRVLIG
jgi:probable F420-dependent oxidoreductase